MFTQTSLSVVIIDNDSFKMNSQLLQPGTKETEVASQPLFRRDHMRAPMCGKCALQHPFSFNC